MPGLMPTRTQRRSGARMSARPATARLLRRVLRLHLLAADPRDAVVGRDRRLREADRDQGDLALVPGHVAGRVDARQARLHARRDLDLALVLELQAPVRD